MMLRNLIEGLGLKAHAAPAADPRGPQINAITDDSRTATPGCLFIARGGSKADGRKFIADAVARGAAAVVADDVDPDAVKAPGRGVVWVTPVPGTTVDHTLASRLAERFFGEPGKKLKLIAVTGTNGKTTITFVIQHLLRHAGIKAGVIGTVFIDDGARQTPATLTTPGGVEFSRHLAAMVANGCAAAITEVSSHALHQGRLGALDFNVAIFTNLTGDHLDYHQTMENYAAAKAMLFEGLGPQAWAVVNGDDAWAPRMLRDCKARAVRCGIEGTRVPAQSSGVWGLGEEKPPALAPSSPQAPEAGAKSCCSATILQLAADHSRVRFDGPWGSVEVKLPLVGRHNVMNVLQAAAAANCVAPIDRGLRDALEHCPAPPGRLEPVRIAGKSGLPAVLVDYAHTHDALENVLSALKPVTPGRLIVVFGCGGDRDRTKRPKMAAVCCRLADRVVITSDNPRTEEPAFIIGQVLTGVPAPRRPGGLTPIAVEGVDAGEIERMAGDPRNGLEVSVQPDRAAAIAAAIAQAGPDDTVLIAGKGHEDYQIIGVTKRHFDDREEAAKVLMKKAQA